MVQGWVGESTQLNQHGVGNVSLPQLIGVTASLGKGSGQERCLPVVSSMKKRVHATTTGRPSWPRKEIQAPNFTHSNCPSWEVSFRRNLVLA